MIFLFAFMLFATATAEEDRIVIELFHGEATVPGAWQLAASVNTTNAYGSFDPSLISEDGCFVVTYTGTPDGVYLALSEWQRGVWSQTNAPSACVADGDTFMATFTYDQLLTSYGSGDFSDVDQICVGSANAVGETTILGITWYGKPLQDELGADAVLFRGAASSSAENSNLAFVFTRHAGGEFDASVIGTGARFYAEYTGPQNGVYLALSSHSGATQWARVNPSEVIALGVSTYGAYFDLNDMVNAWGHHFAMLDQLTVFSAASEAVTLRKLAYFAGDGEPLDSSDASWVRPDTGIAFIGDSICQNAQLIYGDWNTILGRTDCCNYGIGGQTTKELAARIGDVANRDYSQVVFICGINDIGRGHTNDQIVGNFDQMIQTIRQLNPDCQFLLVSVLPTTSAFYVGQQNKICQLNHAYEAYAAGMEGVTYVDAYSAFTDRAGAYAYPELLSDGLHPNQAGYAMLAEILTPYLIP